MNHRIYGSKIQGELYWRICFRHQQNSVDQGIKQPFSLQHENRGISLDLKGGINSPQFMNSLFYDIRTMIFEYFKIGNNGVIFYSMFQFFFWVINNSLFLFVKFVSITSIMCFNYIHVVGLCPLFRANQINFLLLANSNFRIQEYFGNCTKAFVGLKKSKSIYKYNVSRKQL